MLLNVYFIPGYRRLPVPAYTTSRYHNPRAHLLHGLLASSCHQSMCGTPFSSTAFLKTHWLVKSSLSFHTWVHNMTVLPMLFRHATNVCVSKASQRSPTIVIAVRGGTTVVMAKVCIPTFALIESFTPWVPSQPKDISGRHRWHLHWPPLLQQVQVPSATQQCEGQVLSSA